MGLDDEPMVSGTVRTSGVATTRKDISRAYSLMQTRRLYGQSVVLSALAGFVFGVGISIFLGLPIPPLFVGLVGAVALPSLFAWRAKRMTKKYEAEQTALRYEEEAARNELLREKIKEARVRGDFERFGK